MPAVIRRVCIHGGSIRVGPACFRWGDPYTRSLSFEIEGVNLAVIGGLTEPLSREEYRWLEAAFIEAGLRTAVDRAVTGPDGQRLFDAAGQPMFRRVLMPMPNWPRRTG